MHQNAAIFELIRVFDRILLAYKFHYDVSNGSRVKGKLKALRYGSYSVTCKLHRTCLYLVSIHQIAHPQTEVADI